VVTEIGKPSAYAYFDYGESIQAKYIAEQIPPLKVQSIRYSGIS